MEIIWSKGAFEETKAEGTLIFVVGKDFSPAFIQDADLFEGVGFEGKEGQTLFIPGSKTLYYALESLSADSLREASAKALRILKKYPLRSFKVAVALEDSLEYLEAMIAGFLLGDYSFETYKSQKNPSKLETILLPAPTLGVRLEEAAFGRLIAKQEAIAKAVNLARELVNTPPEEATPKKLAVVAEAIAKEHDLECVIKDEKFLEKAGMGAFLAVSRASVHPPRLIHLTHKGTKKPKLKVALVGKGLTYDSGGLSLKPADYMVTMKADKGGGCAVMAIMQAASALGLELELHGIVGAAENMIGGNAYKPDDVLVAKNGKTIEVRNTDAEGRLVLADCLVYAQELKPDYIIDLATLTGACVVALGEYSSGVLGHNEKLKRKFIKCAEKSGELAVNLPFNRHLKKLIESKVADMCNVSSTRYGGSITAGLFLSEFIEESYQSKWIHLDIAGPAYVEKEWDVNPHGASGAGVRMVLEFLQYLIKEA